MSLLDTLGSLLGKSPESGSKQALIATALEFVNNQPGGLNGLIQQFQEKGAGDIIKSWIGNGANLPIAASVLQNVLGQDTVSGLAAKAGMQPEQVTGLLSQVLPHVVNAATPNGEVPSEGKLNPSAILGALGGLGGLASLFGGKSDAEKKA
ncbi:YidB family protein [Paraburkholderia bonniea]|uniref:YidB family protein n=1 Tax=Paraburkholderia bonniea TaxID=2152891 RepID=UPI0012924A09|nr:YidB family protein [Paraburkholderia bonniea]WJF88972.1 YidB family protein [Paraburkholderia bonniea]WJF92288.1 YidB family protein [Paraburkholderia bonniea]